MKILLWSLFMLLPATSYALPEGFVYINDVDPSIIINNRYVGHENFVGKTIEGYSNPHKAVLTKEAAIALKKAQEIFNKDGYKIVVYDSYRPQTAVNFFVKWAKDVSDQLMKKEYFPRIDKAKIFELEYLFERSGHSRGSTVDLSILPINQELKPINPTPRKFNDGFEFLYLDDGTIDTGSSFDLFDEASHVDNNLITAEQQKNRDYLSKVMIQAGFKQIPTEWWHFTLKDEPFPDKYFDFFVK